MPIAKVIDCQKWQDVLSRVTWALLKLPI